MIGKIVGLIGAGALAGWLLAAPRQISQSGATPHQATLEDKLKSVADRMSAGGPRSLGSGMTLESLTAKKSTLVMAVSGIPEGGGLSGESMGGILARSACHSDGIHEIFAQGALLEIDLSLQNGTSLPPVTFDRCP